MSNQHEELLPASIPPDASVLGGEIAPEKDQLAAETDQIESETPQETGNGNTEDSNGSQGENGVHVETAEDEEGEIKTTETAESEIENSGSKHANGEGSGPDPETDLETKELESANATQLPADLPKSGPDPEAEAENKEKDSEAVEPHSTEEAPLDASEAAIPAIEVNPPADQADSESSQRASKDEPSETKPAPQVRRSLAKVDNTAIFSKTFESILHSREALKNSALKTATQTALDSLNNHESRDPHVMFQALKLACESASSELKSSAVDLFAKLFDYVTFEDELERVNLTDASVDVISLCFDGEGTDPELELQVVRALTHSIVLMPTHGALLLKAVRQIYNVFIFSLNPRNQAVAQGTLTQVIGTVFLRVAESAKAHPTAVADAAPAQNGKITLENLQKESDAERVSEASKTSEKDEDMAVKDAFLIFRAMCKLSVKDLDTENVDMRSHSVRSKLLSLHVIHSILRNNIDIFLRKDVVILSSSSDEQTRLIDAVRSYLCQALIRNAASPLAPIFELTLETFWLLITNLRSDFKMEIPVLWEQIYFPVAEMKTSTPHQKRYLLSIIERLCNDSRCIIEFYLNYDCDSSQPNICEAVIDYLTRLSLARIDATPAQKMAFRDNQRAGIALYDINKIDNLSTATMSSKPPEPDIYNNFPLEYALKITSLNCLVAFMRLLHLWAQKGFVSQKLTSLMPGSDPQSPFATASSSRNPSFVGHTERDSESDDPEQFETQKQRKKALLEGTRRFSQKAKKGIAYFVENGFIESDTPQDIARFLLETEGLDKAALGEYLGEVGEKNVAIMHAFVDLMDFKDMSFVDSLRTFLQLFRLPGEGQKIDRFMLKFAERYVLGNPKVFANADTAYVLAYSVVMLNTDQHSKSVKSRMTVDNFIMNNSGIDDGKDLPREFLEQVFDEIKENEIKLQSEQHAALLAGDQTVISATPSGFFGTRDWNREAYNHASKEMLTRTEKLVKNLGRKLRSEDASQIYYAASNVQHVKSIFDTTWMSILAGLTAPFKEFEESDVIALCLEGIKFSIKISCMFDLQYAKTSFIGALVQFQNLNNYEDIKLKNVEAIYVMLEIAVTEGNSLQKSWLDILTSISQLERLQLIAKGIDQNSIPDVSSAKLVSRNSIESVTSQPTGLFLLFTSSSASTSASIRYHTQHLSAEASELLSRTELSVAIDKVFTNSSDLSGESIKYFVEALSRVATEEIESSGQSNNPRMFSLQKVVDICYYNMDRIRLEWSQLWVILGEVFNTVGCNPNLTVDFFALDSLRQLSMRFMDIDELAHFKFQKEFLKPFQHIIVHNQSPEVKDMVLECINNMLLAKAPQIKSGWKTIFNVLTVAAKEKKGPLVTKAYKLAFTINKDYGDEVVKQDSFADLVACFTEFAKNENFQKVGLLSLEVLSKSMIKVAKHSIEQTGDQTISASDSETSDKYNSLVTLWFPILFGFFDIIMNGEELEVRSRTLSHFFDVLHKYGDHFENDFWDMIFHKLLSPMFEILQGPWKLTRSDKFNFQGFLSDEDKLSFWVSTTLIQALNSMVSLFTQFFEQLSRLLPEFMDLLVSCICQDNDTIARTGKTCFEEFLIKNCANFDDKQWDLAIGTFERLFDLTTAKELFALDPLLTAENSDVESLDIDEDDGAGDKSTIVVKCVLQLLLIETTLEMLLKEDFYNEIPSQHLLKLTSLLHGSYEFARKFNDDYDLRVRLWNAGVIERLPNLLKQESMSAAVFLNVMFRLYCDNTKVKTKDEKRDIMLSVVPLSAGIVERYCELEDATQQKSISTWSPVITEIFEGYVEMDERDFVEHAPVMYRNLLRLLERNMAGGLRTLFRQFMARVGEIFVKST